MPFAYGFRSFVENLLGPDSRPRHGLHQPPVDSPSYDRKRAQKTFACASSGLGPFASLFCRQRPAGIIYRNRAQLLPPPVASISLPASRDGGIPPVGENAQVSPGAV